MVLAEYRELPGKFYPALFLSRQYLLLKFTSYIPEPALVLKEAHNRMETP